nr:MAG TPA: hypothetical protein [Caudoviricetes sp.]
METSSIKHRGKTGKVKLCLKISLPLKILII